MRRGTEYQFETIDDRDGLHQPSYHRLSKDLTVRHEYPYSNLDQSSRIHLANVDENHQTLHRAYKNSNSLTHLPPQSLSRLNHQPQFTNRRVDAPYELGSPLKKYAQQFYLSPHQIEAASPPPPIQFVPPQIPVEQFPQYQPPLAQQMHYQQQLPLPPQQVHIPQHRNSEVIYHNDRGSMQIPLQASQHHTIRQFHPQEFNNNKNQPEIEFYNAPRFIPPVAYEDPNKEYKEAMAQKKKLEREYQDYIDQEQMVDVFCDLPKDQCYYCVSEKSSKPFDSSQYYNAGWVEDRDKINRKFESIHRKNAMLRNNRKGWEQEIADEYQSSNTINSKKKLDDFDSEGSLYMKKNNKIEFKDDNLQNVSIESEITTEPTPYRLRPQNMGYDSSELDKLMDIQRRESSLQMGGVMKASLFTKRLKDRADETRLKREMEEINNNFTLQDDFFAQFDRLNEYEIDGTQDPDYQRQLELYQHMNRFHELMKKDQSFSQITFAEFLEFMRSQLGDIKEKYIVNGLDKLAKQVMMSN